MNKNNKKILVSGSIVYDRIMDFPGFFKDHILPDQTHILNVSFTLNRIKESFGGTAGNIAYNLALLNQPVNILGVVGNDFMPYANWLKKHKIDISKIKKVSGLPTASAYIMNDKADNQISGFYPGSLDVNYCKVVKNIKNVALAIVSPDFKPRMLAYVRLYKQLGIPYIFDPGQQITSFSSSELKKSIKGAKVLIGNDYEIKLIINKTKLSLKELIKLVEILVITKGAQGSEIYTKNKKIKVLPVKVKKIVDPTGAGDAYRAGFITGLLENDLVKAGKLGSLIASEAVAKQGTQVHYFTFQQFIKKYKINYKEIL